MAYSLNKLYPLWRGQIGAIEQLLQYTLCILLPAFRSIGMKSPYQNVRKLSSLFYGKLRTLSQRQEEIKRPLPLCRMLSAVLVQEHGDISSVSGRKIEPLRRQRKGLKCLLVHL